MDDHRHPAALLLILALAAAASFALAVAFGSGSVGPRDLLALLRGEADPTAAQIIVSLRLPRAAAAFGTGALLALAGVLMQALLRNALADPYILGTSGGAATFAVAALFLGAPAAVVHLGAFGGALASTLVVFLLARGGAWESSRLLLTGVVVAAGWNAALSLILALGPERELRGAMFWLMGDFGYAREATWPLVAAVTGLAGCLLAARPLNVLATGDAQATLLGLAVRPARALAYAGGAFLTGIAVTTAGTVGFVGLVVPHLVRLAAGADHRVVVPGAALGGGALLVLADLLARTLVAPRQLPVGAVTAVVGVPVFLALLRQARRAR